MHDRNTSCLLIKRVKKSLFFLFFSSSSSRLHQSLPFDNNSPSVCVLCPFPVHWAGRRWTRRRHPVLFSADHREATGSTSRPRERAADRVIFILTTLDESEDWNKYLSVASIAYWFFFSVSLSDETHSPASNSLMGARLTRSDFHWDYSDEPHTTRRREMLRRSSPIAQDAISTDCFLEKYPQIRQLMGHDWRIAVQVVITVLIQLVMAVLVRDLPWKFVWLFTYVISGTLNHSLSISFHESKCWRTSETSRDEWWGNVAVGHNLAFGNHRPMANRILGYIANLPLGIPSSVTFKKYHIDHHK